VHLGHTVPPEDDTEIAAPFLLSFGGVTGPGRFEMAAIAAFTTCIVGGLMPQARHGGIGVRDASAGSKLEGTGFEKEQIGHTQDALIDGGGAGLFRRSGEPDAGLGAAGALNPRESWFAGLGKRVILGEDLRKPAYVRRQYPLSRASMRNQAYIEVRLLYVFEEDGDRVLTRLGMINIANSVGGQICLAVLVLRDLEFAVREASVAWRELQGMLQERTPHKVQRRLARTITSPQAKATGAERWSSRAGAGTFRPFMGWINGHDEPGGVPVARIHQGRHSSY
jgi:hypothetical protein